MSSSPRLTLRLASLARIEDPVTGATRVHIRARSVALTTLSDAQQRDGRIGKAAGELHAAAGRRC